MLGKVLIIKTFIIPIFTFIVSSCVIPEKYPQKEIEIKSFKLILNLKPDKVNRNILIGDFEKGWLKIIDILSRKLLDIFEGIMGK